MFDESFDTALSVERVAKYFVVGKKKVREDIDGGVLSSFSDDRKRRRVEFSEAERVYKLRPEYQKEISEQGETGDASISKEASFADMVELEKYRTRCDALTEMLERRDEDVEFLRKELSKSSNLLSDQRSNAEKEAERAARLNEVQESINRMQADHQEEILLLKKQTHRILTELRESRKPFWKWLFGSKQPYGQSGKQRA